MDEPKSTTTAPPKRAARRVPAAKAGPAKESRGAELLHELFRLAKVDLRSSQHGQALAAELGDLIGGKH
jgi:hypothetical protein